MEEREKINKKRENAIKRLTSVRKTWFFYIWLGYSCIIFALFYNLLESSKDGWWIIAIISIILGIVCYVINAFVWSHCCEDINNAKKYVEYLDKELVKLNTKDNYSSKTIEQPLPEKYLNCGFTESQLNDIRWALFENNMSEEDIDAFFSEGGEPRLLIAYCVHFKSAIELSARPDAIKETLRIHKNTTK